MAEKTLSPIELQEYLRGVRHPATKDSLCSAAKDSGAPPEVMETLQRLPDEDYDGPPAVMKAFGEIE
ncbi:MAG: DUF2795 domain-containing protein [Planctomycetaceae bacterium]|nr:DUF2795 domain-containing protein [Planctomycetaceae bacterium]